MQPALCCGLGLLSKGWRRRLGRKIHFSQLPHLQSRRRRQEAAHVPVSSQTPAAAYLKPGHAAPRRVGESPSGNICLLRGIFDSSIYLDSPGCQSQRLIHTWTLLPHGLRVREPHRADSFLQVWSSESTMLALAPVSLTTQPPSPHASLLQHCPTCLSVSMHLNARHLTTPGNLGGKSGGPAPSPLHHCSLFSIPGLEEWLHHLSFISVFTSDSHCLQPFL